MNWEEGKNDCSSKKGTAGTRADCAHHAVPFAYFSFPCAPLILLQGLTQGGDVLPQSLNLAAKRGHLIG